ncbi:MAG: glycerate kinase [Austwickia sp.]|nr:glycerate kinase [Actinomycetota bacterium]MCO5311114.1 glycerate kinase [Austwickia sp.]
MRVLICPQRFGGTLTAVQAAEAIAAGWRSRCPHDELTLAPISGGGAGFLDVLATAVEGGITVAATVSDPLGREVPAAVLMVAEGGMTTAYVEAAQAAGLHLLAGNERNPLVTSSYGVGQLIEVARAEGAARIVVAVGEAATNDGGAGMLAALGAGPDAALAHGGAKLATLGEDQLADLGTVRERLAGIELILATQEDLPLLGLQGTSAATAGMRGAGPAEAQQLEAALGWYRAVADRACPPATDLMTGLARRLDREPGAGAGGGIGYGLLLLGARRQSAAAWCFDAWDMPALMSATDLVLTGEGSLDYRTLRGSVIGEVAALAAARGLPVVALAGTVEVGRRDSMALGLSGTYAVADTGVSVVEAMADPVGTLSSRAARVAATWSPPPTA